MKMQNIRKILVIKLDHIGDLILATPVFRSLKETYKEAELAVMVATKSAVVIENSPYIDKIYYYDADDFDRGKNNTGKTYFNNFMTICSIREEKFDLCIGLREDLNNVVIQKMLGAKKYISFSTNTIYASLLDESVPNIEEKHASEINFDLLELVHVKKPEEMKPEIFYKREDIIWVEEFLKQNNIKTNEILIAISPGGGWFLNWWPYQNFTELANRLIKNNKRVRIIWIGGNAEEDLMKKIEEGMKYPTISAVGKTTICRLAALYSRVNLVITNDGGPMHVATTANVPLIALFGPSPYKRFGPLGTKSNIISKDFKCSPCPQFVQENTNHCLDNKCMKAITVEEVYNLALKVLGENVL